MAIGQNQVLIIYYLRAKFATFSLTKVEPNFKVILFFCHIMEVMDTLWSHLNEKRVICSNKLEIGIEKYIQKVRDMYFPSGSKGPLNTIVI